MKKETSVKLTEKLISGLLTGFSATLKDGVGFVSAESYVSEDFYEGTKKFLKNPKKNAKWSMGFSDKVLTPIDFMSRSYFLGGYIAPENRFKNLVESVVDAMKCRAVAFDDNSGRGITVFCTIDCIGTTNADIRIIRRKFKEKYLKEFPNGKIASINVCSTHTHSCIDTEGLWTDFPGKMFRNIRRNRTGHGIPERGADEQYMRFLYEAVSDTLLKAALDMTDGRLLLAQKDISTDYFNNKNRPSATSIVTDITRLTFLPDNKSKTPTIIINLPAHPDVAGLPTADGKGDGRTLSGDYIYYMGELINKAGFNFMFFNGAICAIYMARGASNDGLSFSHRYEESVRFGVEIGRISLSLTKSLDEIKKDSLLYDEDEIARDTELSKRNGGKYTLWCDNWEKTTETEIKPLLNIRLKEVRVPITNPLICAAGKLNLANYHVLTDGKNNYSAFTEIGYIEFGKELKVAMVPGEFCCDLLCGGDSLKAAGAVSKTDFGLPSVRDIFGSDTIAFGLSNDAIGYIVPDNDYTMGDPQNHYHELVSLGKYVGSSVIKGFIDIKKELTE